MNNKINKNIDCNQNDDKIKRMAQKEKEVIGNMTLQVNRESEKDLVDMLAKHRTETERKNSLKQHIHYKAELEFGRDNYQRTASMLSYLSGVEDDEVMTNKYKYVTTVVLWFCYFSLALNDYIFGPTFDDLSQLLGVSFATISFFPIVRQVSYTCGALGGFAFNYVNRQLTLAALLIISAFTLIATPFSRSVDLFFAIGAINGFAAGACDIGFHVWIIEMFEDGGGPLLQALHFSFGLGITIAPSITAFFLSGEGSECSSVSHDDDIYTSLNTTTSVSTPTKHNQLLFIPYVISAVIVCSGGLALIVLYIYKKYVPPREPKAPHAFTEEMPKELSKSEKFQLWRENIPSSYSILLITFGSVLLMFYYGLEVTYFQFMAQFITATPLPIFGTESALVETATGAAYAIGGAISIYLSTRLKPQQMLYINFLIINFGCILLIMFFEKSLPILWIGNVLVGLGFSSTYASAYTFLEHHINVTNAIGSIFLLAGGAGTAILPLFLSQICEHPEYMLIMCLICTLVSALVFLALHIMTEKRTKQIDMIKKQLNKCPAILLGYRQKSFTILSL